MEKKNNDTILQRLNIFWKEYDKVWKIKTIISRKIAEYQYFHDLFLPFFYKGIGVTFYTRSIDPREIFLVLCNGFELNRPDITIRYLAIIDIVNGNIENGEGLRLYKKYFSSLGDNPDPYVDKFIVLINSIVANGFYNNPRYHITLDKSKRLINGAHRLSCALFFGENAIRFRNTFTQSEILMWDRIINGSFSDDEIEFIRRESDKLVESIIKNRKNEKIIDKRALRKWIIKEYAKVYRFDKRKYNGNSFVSAKNGEFYQSFPMLDIKGYRPTDKRIEQYDLKEILDTQMDVLDIGCNIGFMDMEIAPLVRSVTGIEFNPVASRLSKGIAQKLDIRNVAFFDGDFKEWKSMSLRKYDVILSLEIHQCIDLSPQEYIAKIISHIKPNGIILFEGNILAEKNNVYNNYIDVFLSNGFKSIKSGFCMDDESVKRKWTLLQQS